MHLMNAEVPHVHRLPSNMLGFQQAHVWWRSLRYVCRCEKASMQCESVSETDFSLWQSDPDCRGTSSSTRALVCVAATASPCVVAFAALRMSVPESVYVV